MLHIVGQTGQICNPCVAKALSVALAKTLALTLSATCQTDERLDEFCDYLRAQVDVETIARSLRLSPEERVH